MKPNEIRDLTLDEIEDEVTKHREELLDLRFQTSMGQASNPRRIRAIKRNIARLLTIAGEKTALEQQALEQHTSDPSDQRTAQSI
ncbi:MAG: 50S ribosomal protein L29 [Deinococcota bacterium]